MSFETWMLGLIALAVGMTALGGSLDMWTNQGPRLTKHHAWNDGIFLLLLVIALTLLFKK